MSVRVTTGKMGMYGRMLGYLYAIANVKHHTNMHWALTRCLCGSSCNVKGGPPSYPCNRPFHFSIQDHPYIPSYPPYSFFPIFLFCQLSSPLNSFPFFCPHPLCVTTRQPGERCQLPQYIDHIRGVSGVPDKTEFCAFEK